MIGLSNSLKAQCTWAGLPLALTGSTGTSYTGNDLHITGNLTITATATWTNCKVKIDSCVIITVDDGVVFTLNGTCIDAAQNKRWRTIRIRPTGELVTSNSCYFADADTVINSINGGKYTISSTTIEKSFVGLRVSPFGGTHAGTVNGLTINGSASMYTSCFNSIIQSRYGIHVDGASAGTVNFGSGGGSTNRIADCETGIFIEGINTNIKNFDLTSMNVGGNQDACIVAEGIYGTSHTIYVGGSAANEDVYMAESENGILAKLNYNVTVEYSTLEFLSRSGILIDDCDARDLLVQNCFIRDVGDGPNEWGILVDNCDNSDITINDNYLTFSNSYQTGTAIWVTDAAGSNTVEIARDTIINRTRGIKGETLNSALIEENVIIEIPTGPSNNVWGIMDYSGDNCTIIGNYLSTSLYSNVVSIWPKGILVDQYAIGESLTCNQIDSLNTHIEVEANNPVVHYLYGNFMYKGYRGLTLLAVGSTLTANPIAGDIGPQGFSGPGGFTSDNLWKGGFAQACVRSQFCGAANLTAFAVRTSSLPWDPTSCTNSAGIGASVPSFTAYTGLDTIVCSQYYSNRMMNSGSEQSESSLHSINESLPNYAQWNIHFGNLTLLRGVDDLNADEQVYLDAFAGSNLMQIINTFKSIRLGEFTGLSSDVASINPTCQQEQNFKEYLSIYLNHVEDHSVITDNERMILESILEQCPARAGKAIAYARTYLGIPDFEYSYENCGDLLEDTPFVAEKFGINSNSDFAISPNPVKTGEGFTISNKNEKEFNLEILDLNGRLLHSQQQISKTVHLVLSDLSPGMYLVKIIPAEGNIETKRIVIIK